VTVNGSIVSQGQGHDFGIFLGSSANINNAGTISGSTGIEMFNGGTHTITNSGSINGTSFGIFDAGGSIDTVPTPIDRRQRTLHGDVGRRHSAQPRPR
jgi:hypothetical protein